MIFHRTGLVKQKIKDWLSLPPENWFTQSIFKSSQNYAKSLIVVNDQSGRPVGVNLQYIHLYNYQEGKQDILLAVEKVRYAFRTK